MHENEGKGCCGSIKEVEGPPQRDVMNSKQKTDDKEDQSRLGMSHHEGRLVVGRGTNRSEKGEDKQVRRGKERREEVVKAI